MEELGMSLSANPVDEADILATIRSKLADAKIQRSYWLDSQVFRRRGDGGLCQGCDRPILRTDRTSVGYVSTKGERHWFHLLCDTVRQFVAANELKREHRTRGSAKRLRSPSGVEVLSDIGVSHDLRDELVDVARAT
jgi:hypothetical protein